MSNDGCCLTQSTSSVWADLMEEVQETVSLARQVKDTANTKVEFLVGGQPTEGKTAAVPAPNGYVQDISCNMRLIRDYLLEARRAMERI